MPQAAVAREVTTVVDARSMPWSGRLNRNLQFDAQAAIPPKILWGLGLVPGFNVSFVATGKVTIYPTYQQVGPDGAILVDANPFLSYINLPQKHVGSRMFIGELMGAFVDADGIVVGKPFGIGKAATVVVPEGAVGLSMGLNDIIFGDNYGTFTVAITIQQPSVTVELPEDEPK